MLRCGALTPRRLGCERSTRGEGRKEQRLHVRHIKGGPAAALLGQPAVFSYCLVSVFTPLGGLPYASRTGQAGILDRRNCYRDISHPTLRDGVTQAGSPFDPPPFPPQFMQAAFLQSASFVFQIIPGVRGGPELLGEFLYGIALCVGRIRWRTAGLADNGDHTAFFSAVSVGTAGGF